MPRNRKTDSPRGKGRSLPELSDAVDDLETSRKIHANDIAILKWVVGVSVAMFVLLSAAVIQFSLHNINANNVLRQENIEIRADHNDLRLEFELYKAQNPK